MSEKNRTRKMLCSAKKKEKKEKKKITCSTHPFRVVASEKEWKEKRIII